VVDLASITVGTTLHFEQARNSLSQSLAKLDYEDVDIRQSKVPLTVAR
jgi:hypothetical protein